MISCSTSPSKLRSCFGWFWHFASCCRSKQEPLSNLAQLALNSYSICWAALIRLGLAGTARQEVVKQISSDADPRKKTATPKSRSPRVNVALGLSDFLLFRQEPAIQLQHFWGTWRKLRTKSRGSLKDWGKLREVQRSHVSIIGFHFLTWTTAYQYLRTGWSARNSETGVSTWSIFTGFDQPLLSRRPSDGQRSKHHGLFLAHCHSPPASRRGKILRRRLSHI